MSPLSVHGSGLAKRLQANVNTANVVVERSGQETAAAQQSEALPRRKGAVT